MATARRPSRPRQTYQGSFAIKNAGVFIYFAVQFIWQNVYGLYFLFRHGYPTTVLSGAQNPCVVYYLVNGKQIRNGQLRIIMYK